MEDDGWKSNVLAATGEVGESDYWTEPHLCLMTPEGCGFIRRRKVARGAVKGSEGTSVQISRCPVLKSWFSLGFLQAVSTLKNEVVRSMSIILSNVDAPC